MEKKYIVRPVEVKDLPTLKEWWDSYDYMETPDIQMLPDEGTGGFVVEKEGKSKAAAFLYFTNSDIAYVDYLVADPNYKGKDRYDMILDLIEECTRVGIGAGCRLMWAMTTFDGIVDRCRDLGFDVLPDKYTFIYTHQKVYSDLVEDEK